MISRPKAFLSTFVIWSILVFSIAPSEAEPLRIAYSIISWTMSAAYMAEDAGLFKGHRQQRDG